MYLDLQLLPLNFCVGAVNASWNPVQAVISLSPLPGSHFASGKQTKRNYRVFRGNPKHRNSEYIQRYTIDDIVGDLAAFFWVVLLAVLCSLSSHFPCFCVKPQATAHHGELRSSATPLLPAQLNINLPTNQPSTATCDFRQSHPLGTR